MGETKSLTPTKDQVEQARERIKQFAREAKADPEIMKRLKGDPVHTLVSAGVPQYAVIDFLHEEGLGHVAVNLGAASCWISCACSKCCISG
jgi:hypothetical protein